MRRFWMVGLAVVAAACFTTAAMARDEAGDKNKAGRPPGSANGRGRGPGQGPGRGGPGFNPAHMAEMLFKRLDTNKDNYLSKEEFAKMGEQRKAPDKGQVDRSQMLDRIFAKLDKDGDGQLSLTEFKDMSRLREEMAKNRGKKDKDK